MRAFSVLFFLWIATVVRAGDFDEANALYDAGKFTEAKHRYESMAGRGEWSANLFYNLGNAAFRSGASGKAALSYERALALDGSHVEARANLKWLREQTGAKVPARLWWEYAFPSGAGDVFAVIAMVAFWAGVFAMVWRRSYGWGTMALLLAVYAGAGVWRLDRENAVAIITGNEVSAKLAPADRAALAEPLPAGSRVRVLSERGEWIYCALPGGGRGWIPEPQLEKVGLKKS
jgi:tetratricopeptide (TPR) repeat protein